MSHPLLLLSGGCIVLYVLQTLPLLITLSIVFFVAYLAISASQNKGMSTRRKVMLATWTAPSEGNIYGVLNVNAEPLLAFIEKQKQAGTKVTVTTIVAKAIAKAFRQAPGLNCRILFDKFVPKESIDVSMLVQLDEGKDLAFVKVENADKKSLVDIQGETQKRYEKLRSHSDEEFNKSKPIIKLLPVAVIRPMLSFFGWLGSCVGISIKPLGVQASPFGTCMITSVGPLGINMGFAPHTPFANVPIIILIGATEKRAVVGSDGKVEARSELTLTATIDHRYVDGFEIGKLAKVLKQGLEQPESLDAPESPVEAKDAKKDN